MPHLFQNLDFRRTKRDKTTKRRVGGNKRVWKRPTHQPRDLQKIYHVVTDHETEATNMKNKCRNVERRESFRKRQKTASWEILRELY